MRQQIDRERSCKRSYTPASCLKVQDAELLVDSKAEEVAYANGVIDGSPRILDNFRVESLFFH